MSNNPKQVQTKPLKFKIKKVKEYSPEIGDYYKPNKTLPIKYITNSGISKKPEWLQIEGCPCIIISVSDANQTVELNSFSAAPGRNFRIKLDDLRDNFIKCPLVDVYITNLMTILINII